MNEVPRDRDGLRLFRDLRRLDPGSLRPVDFMLGLLVLAGTFARIADGERWTIVPPGGASELAVFVAAGAAVGGRRFPLPALAVTATMDALEHWHDLGGVGVHIAFMI